MPCLLIPAFSFHQSTHSTETTLLSTLDNIYWSADDGKPSSPNSLDRSAAFDMIDHRILLSRLHTSFGITDSAFKFFQSYLISRPQSVSEGQASSSLTFCKLGVPYDTVFGPILVHSIPHKLAILLLTWTFPYSKTLIILNFSSHPLSTPFKPVSPILSFALSHSTHSFPTMVLHLTVIRLKQLLWAPGRKFKLILPLLASALQHCLSG